ncbi:MAG: 23S rRNA (adenine(2503)-C(2))-methyltransferase RlmN [Firmicutes bacterium]|nr:23S rRNA (adenine(2503)-C(2))-methyltransferase RlmN [Bacillota bacterium]
MDDNRVFTIPGDEIAYKDMSLEQLEKLMFEIGEKNFRAKQVAKWLFQHGVNSLDEMTDLPVTLRARLKKIGHAGGLAVLKKQVSQQDGTRKYLFGLHDGNAVEGVLMSYRHGFTACVSSQVGCRMACKLCASGLGGLVRNLSSGEIYDQVLAMQKDVGMRIRNVVLMGSGEPLDNYDHVISFIKKINAEYGLNISYRHITLSSCGLVPQIKSLSEEKMPITLAVSLHAPNNRLRNLLVPINKKYSLQELLSACAHYAGVTGRRITFEYALIADLNDTQELAEELAEKLKKLLCLVNLIPANPVPERGIERTTKTKVVRFKTILEAKGVNVTVRRELGTDIDAACGQLRRRVLGRKSRYE